MKKYLLIMMLLLTTSYANDFYLLKDHKLLIDGDNKNYIVNNVLNKILKKNLNGVELLNELLLSNIHLEFDERKFITLKKFKKFNFVLNQNFKETDFKILEDNLDENEDIFFLKDTNELYLSLTKFNYIKMINILNEKGFINE